MSKGEKVVELRRKCPSLTLQEIGDSVHLTRERVRQILNKNGLPTIGVYIPLKERSPHGKLTVPVPSGDSPYKPGTIYKGRNE